MSRYQRGHIYEAFEPFTFDSIKPGWVTDSSPACRSHIVSVPRIRKYYSAKSKPVQLLCDDLMRKVNTATVTEQDMTVAQFWEKRYLPYREEIVN